MGGSRKPGPQCQGQFPVLVEDGTMARTGMPPPGTALTRPVSAAVVAQAAKPGRRSREPEEIDFSGLPETLERQLLVGLLYAESSTKAAHGEENAWEKEAIGWTFINRAYYVRHKPKDVTRCYNENFGDGTLLDAVKKGSLAYNPTDEDGKKLDRAPWHEVMNGNRLKSVEELKKGLTEPGKLEHFRLCVEACNHLNPYVDKVYAMPKLHFRVPVGFNRAANKPPNPQRMQGVGKLGTHTFYAFKKGRECR